MRLLPSGTEDFVKTLEQLRRRREAALDELAPSVDEEIRQYRLEREKLLIANAKKWDGVDLTEDSLWVPPEAIKSSHKLLRSESRLALEHALARIEKFQADLKPTSLQAEGEEGLFWGTCVRPLDRLGIYVPGNWAHYSLTLLLAGLPARLAGVKEIIVASAPRKRIALTPHLDPYLLYAAKLLDISSILLAGGPAALSALAFGTKKSAPVQKIVGAGGKRTAVAMMRLSGYLGIGTLSGPTETAFVCDKSSSVEFVAADIVSRADHDPEALLIVFQQDQKWMDELYRRLVQITGEVKEVASQESIQKCLAKNLHCFLTKSLDEAVEAINSLSLGTVCLLMKGSGEWVDRIRSCGQLLMGPYSAPVATDLIGGAVGLVPTLGASAYSLSLSPASFMRRFPFVEVSQSALGRAQEDSLLLAHEEGLSAVDPSFQLRR